MTASRNSTLRLIGLFFLAFTASLLLRLTFSHGTVHAISGAPTSFYPDLDPSGAHDILAIVQIVSTSESNWNTKMKARTTLANLYVPQSMVGQIITIKIIGGCDGSPRDQNWWDGAATVFFMPNDPTSPLATSKDCGASANKDIIYSFIAQATPDPIQDSPGGPNYYAQTLEADASGPETGPFSIRYLNAFQIDASLTPGVFAGISTKPVPCDIGMYPRSCPPARLQVPLDVNGNPMPQTSYSYSSFYGASTPTSLQADVKLGCNGGKGQLFVYDLDSNDASLGQNLVLSLKDSNGGSVSVSDQNLITAIGGGNNEVIPFPIPQLPQYGYPSFNYAPGVSYTFRIDGLSKDNAFQILPTYYPSACSPPPTCNITSLVNLTRGGSTFFPKDQIGFKVDTANVTAGYLLGVNNQGADKSNPSAGAYGNYLVPGNGPVVRAEVPTGDTIGTLVKLVNYDGSISYPSTMTVPDTPGLYNFNWGLVLPGTGWSSSTCGKNVTVTAPADTASCSAISITNLPGSPYPNNKYRVTVSFVNTGTYTWVPGQWNAGYHKWVFPNINTNNYLSNNAASPPTADPNYDARITWSNGASVAPGEIATFQQDIQTPSAWPDGTSYPLEYRMVNDAPSGNGYWLPGSSTCATTLGVGQGTLFDTFNKNKKEAGTVFYCNTYGASHSGTSGADLGIYTFVIKAGDSFCSGIGSMDAGAPDRVDVYPYAEAYNTYYSGYRKCAAGAACIGINRYDQQVMNSASGGWDRASNTGYDLGVSSQPIVKCTSIGIIGTINVGDSYNGPVGVKSDGNTLFTAPNVNGTASVSISPNTGLSPSNNNSGVIAGLAPGGTPSTVLTPAITFGQSGTYNFSGNYAWSGGGYGPTSAGCPSPAIVAVESPYMRFYGNDVSAGSGFQDATGHCIGSSAQAIIAYAHQVGGVYRGAGTQLGAFANGSIITNSSNNFLSLAQTVATPGYSPSARDFSNTPPDFGNFGATSCAADYWSSRNATMMHALSSPATLDSVVDGQYAFSTVAHGSGGAIIGTSTINHKIAVYIDGDVQITGNVVMANVGGAGWTSVATIPSFYLVALGNIYIQPSVSQLDGIYVAQPKTGVPDSGRIYTCASGYMKPANATIVSSGAGGCGQNSLLVNGAFVAQHVNFLRTKGTVRNGSSTDDTYNPANTNVAEQFRYSPELFMATQVAPDPINGSGSFDSIIGLPPSL